MQKIIFYLIKYPQIPLLCLYFCIPKIDLFNFSTFPTGIRIQDLISLIIFSLNFRFIKKFFLNINNFYLIILASIIIYNFFIGNSLNSFVVFSRIFEYFVIGLSFYRLKERKYLIYVVLSINIILALLQKIHLIPVIDPIRGTYFSETMNGSFGTPAEFSYFLILILFILTRYMKSNHSKFLFPIALENSISAAVFSALTLFDYKKFLSLSLVPIYFYIVVFISSSLLNVITFTQNTYYLIASKNSQQMDYTSNKSNLDHKLLSNNWPKKILSQEKNESISLKYRSEKWKLAIKNFLNSKFMGWIFGIGINKAGPLDGGVIKYLSEYGLVGLLFFIYLSKRMSLNAISLIFMVNIAFDAFVSSVVSPLIILICLYEIYKKS